MDVDPESFGGSDQDSHYMSQTSAKKLLEEFVEVTKEPDMVTKVDAKLEVSITADGNVRAYYNDDVPELGRELGTMTITRASNVEWESAEEGWTVRAAHDRELALRFVDGSGIIVSREGDMVSFSSREEALKNEVANFWDLVRPEGRPKSCNRHSDCAAVEATAKVAGKPERYGPGSSRVEHCFDSDCEDCFPK